MVKECGAKIRRGLAGATEEVHSVLTKMAAVKRKEGHGKPAYLYLVASVGASRLRWWLSLWRGWTETSSNRLIHRLFLPCYKFVAIRIPFPCIGNNYCNSIAGKLRCT